MLLDHSQSRLISERLIYKLSESATFCEQGGRGHHKAELRLVCWTLLIRIHS